MSVDNKVDKNLTKSKRQLKSEVLRKEREGQTGINNFGLEYKIINHFSSDDITVQFTEDGTIVEHKSYNSFLNGSIENPNNNPRTKLKNERIGQRFKTNAGLWIKVIDYESTNNVTIQFECDGCVRTNVIWSSIERGQVSHPSKMAVKDGSVRIGEINTMNNGMEAIIVDYHDADNVDIKFLEDEMQVYGVTYFNFKKGCIAHPKITCSNLMSLQEFAIRYYLEKYGFVKIEKGEWEDKGFGRLELDFYHHEANIAIE